MMGSTRRSALHGIRGAGVTRGPFGTASGPVRRLATACGLLVFLAGAAAAAGAAEIAQDVQTPSGSQPAMRSAPEKPTLPPFMRGMYSTPDIERRTGRAFVVEEAGRAVLRSLWIESVEANQERVACIAGYRDGEIFHVTNAERVPTEKADSMRVTPGPSLEKCGPPEWVGTVHTHIALYLGRPFSTLSPSDRAVMGLWHDRWGVQGAFCVLYSPAEAYCEYGEELGGDVLYSDERRPQ